MALLLIDDHEKNVASLKALLEKSKYTVYSVKSMEGMQLHLREDDILLVLVNTATKFVTFNTICQDIRKDSKNKNIAIIFTSQQPDNYSELAQAFSNGADDYLKKPIKPIELLARIDYHIKKAQHLQSTQKRADKLAQLATIDQLTKLSSRLHFQTILQKELAQSKRHHEQFSIVYLRIKELEKVHTLFGLEKGDVVIKNVANFLKGNMRCSDIISRWQGGDFLFLLPKTDVENAVIFAKNINNLLLRQSMLKSYIPRYAFGMTQNREDDTIVTITSRAKEAMRVACKKDLENIKML